MLRERTVKILAGLLFLALLQVPIGQKNITPLGVCLLLFLCMLLTWAAATIYYHIVFKRFQKSYTALARSGAYSEALEMINDAILKQPRALWMQYERTILFAYRGDFLDFQNAFQYNSQHPKFHTHPYFPVIWMIKCLLDCMMGNPAWRAEVTGIQFVGKHWERSRQHDIARIIPALQLFAKGSYAEALECVKDIHFEYHRPLFEFARRYLYLSLCKKLSIEDDHVHAYERELETFALNDGMRRIAREKLWLQ